MAQLVVPTPLNPMDNVAQLLGIKQAAQGAQIQQQQIATNKRAAAAAEMNSQQQLQIQAILKDPTSWDPTTKQPTTDALQKIGMVHPQTQAELLNAFQMDPKSLETVANLKNESVNRDAATKNAADSLQERRDNDAAVRQQAKDAAEAAANKPVSLAPGDALVRPGGEVMFTNAAKAPTKTEYDQQLEAFNADPELSKKYGIGPVGLGKYQQDQRVQTAAAGRADAAQLAASQNAGTPLAKVDPKLAVSTSEAFQKYNAGYAEAVQSANNMKDSIALAKSGNKLAYAYAPVEGVLTINVGNQVKRVNMNEIEAYGGAGSALDHVKAWLGKAATGASIPDNILADMTELHQKLSQNARGAFKQKVDGLNYGTGASYNIDDPRLTGGSAPAPSGAAPATVKMKAPNGQISNVPAAQVEHFKKLGATVVQ